MLLSFPQAVHILKHNQASYYSFSTVFKTPFKDRHAKESTKEKKKEKKTGNALPPPVCVLVFKPRLKNKVHSKAVCSYPDHFNTIKPVFCMGKEKNLYFSGRYLEGGRLFNRAVCMRFVTRSLVSSFSLVVVGFGFRTNFRLS